MFDCVVVGGGPAGLAAAIYLARYHLSVVVVDNGTSRAEWIPLSRNLAGFPEGISGSALLSRMREQARLYGVIYRRDTILSLQSEMGGFMAQTQQGAIHAATTLLATGVVNRSPDMSSAMHDEALRRGLIRYCPICDAYEMTDQYIAVIGEDLHAVNEAEFIRSYSAHVTLISPTASFSLDDFQRRRLEDIGVKALIGPCVGFELAADHIQIILPSGKYSYRAAYPALGSEVRSELAVNLGANVSTDSCLVVDKHQATNIKGLYAAGDVVLGLDQISSAIGQGGVAATAIRDQLSKERSLLR